MNKNAIVVIASLFALSVAWSQDQCERPWPLNLPQKFESKDDALNGQKSVKAYLGEAEAYLTCNEAAQKSLPPDDEETPQKLNILISRYNFTVDEMHAVGDRYNELVRVFKESEDG